ncbi:MAG: alpha/beta hydrolase [Crocinitomicaceae bacterium]
MLKLIKLYFGTISILSPRLATNQAFELFKKVRKKDIRDREKPFYSSAKRQDIPFGSEPIHTYTFGDSKHDIVLLIHGWDSNAGSLSKFVEPLIKKDKYVISLNLPAHAHYQSEKTTIIECKNAVKVLINSLSTNKNISIISHSFGSAVTGYALSELPAIKVDKLFFLTSPNKMDVIFKEFKDIINLGDKAYTKLVDKASKILCEDLEQMYIHNKLLQSNFEHLYIFHDQEDKIISIKNSELMHEKVPNSDLITYNKIGHYRMLWNDSLVNDVIKKL